MTYHRAKRQSIERLEVTESTIHAISSSSITAFQPRPQIRISAFCEKRIALRARLAYIDQAANGHARGLSNLSGFGSLLGGRPAQLKMNPLIGGEERQIARTTGHRPLGKFLAIH